MILNFCRHRRVRFPRPVPHGNVRQNIRPRTKNLLRISLQSFRLRRHIRVHIRGHMVRGQGRIIRIVCVESAETLEDIQGDQVLVVAEESGDLSAQLYEVHHLTAVPSLFVHTDIRPVGNAAVWWRV